MLNSELVALIHNGKHPSIARSTCHLRMCSLFSPATLILTYHHYCRDRSYSPPPGLPLALPFIGATGLSVLVLTVTQDTQLAHATAVNATIVAVINIFSEG